MIELARTSRIFVAGAGGLVGSAVVRALQQAGHVHILSPRRGKLDLLDARAVDGFFARERPEFVVVAAAKVGGIHANATYPADFLYENLAIATHVIHAAHRYAVGKLLFLGSTCVYPKHAGQPICEAALLSGPLEPTNEWYAVAKIAGIKLCQAFRKQHGCRFISGMPTNLYGEGDNFDPLSSHVVPALIRKCHEAKTSGASEVVVWGSGYPRREFMHVEDCAEACVFLLRHYDDHEPCNIGVGHDMTIRELAELVARVVGFDGQIAFDSSQPDGTPRKLVDTTKLDALGWRPRIGIEDGLRRTYEWFKGLTSRE